MGWKSRALRALLTVVCLYTMVGCGGSTSDLGGVPTVAILPSSAQVEPGGTVQFRTVLENLSGGVVWTVESADGGSVSADGLYTAPNEQGMYTVVARSVTDAAAVTRAVVVVGDALPAIDSSFDFSTSPVQPGIMTISASTGCIRGKLLDRKGRLVTGIGMHLYRLTDAAGRAWEAGQPLDFVLPQPVSGTTRQTGANRLETHRATTRSEPAGTFHERTNNFTFGTTPAGYYLITYDLVLPDGRQAEGMGAVAYVQLGGDAFVNVFTDASPSANSAELLPGQSRPLANSFTHFIGKRGPDLPGVAGFSLFRIQIAPVAGAGTIGGAPPAFTAGDVLGVYTLATAGVYYIGHLKAVVGVAAVHVVGVRSQFDVASLDFDGGTATLSVAAVDGLTGSTATPVPLTCVVTGPDGFSQTVTLEAVEQSATSFDAADYTYPDDWQFFTGAVTLPPNVTSAARAYTAAVTATYAVAGATTQTATITVNGVNQPADPPTLNAR